MENVIKQITTSKLFNNVNIDDIENLLNNINYRIINLVKNEYVFDSFTNSDYIGIILSGNINIEKILPSGKSVFMYSKRKGDIFGEVAAFSKTKHYPCNVISQSKTSLILFHKLEFFKLLELNSNVLNNFLSLICDKTFSLNNRVATLSLYRELDILSKDLVISFIKSNTIKILNIAKLEEVLNIL